MSRAKRDAIKRAYGEHWDRLQDRVDQDGWTRFPISKKFPEVESYGYFKERPISLKGIEDNNGWTRLDEKLPDPGVKVLIVIDGHIQDRLATLESIKIQPQFGNIVTHWKVFEEHKPPIY